jgi:hypothetical protein
LILSLCPIKFDLLRLVHDDLGGEIGKAGSGRKARPRTQNRPTFPGFSAFLTLLQGDGESRQGSAPNPK